MRVRRLTRLFAPALFLSATVILPALHQAFHRRDHDHLGGGIRFHRTGHSHEYGHRHGGGPWHSHGHGTPAEPRSEGPPEDSDPSHGDQSLAHFSYALGEGPPPPVTEASAPLESAPPETSLCQIFPRPAYFRAPSLRGPPSLFSPA